jgi:general secretion pathway protein G
MKPSVRLMSLGLVLIVCLTIGTFYFFRRQKTCGWSTKREREATLRLDLFTMRQAIDQYTLDKQSLPKSLQDLVDAHYLPKIPTDPFTCKSDWVAPTEDVQLGSDLRATGIFDVHSNSDRVDRDGAAYRTW